MISNQQQSAVATKNLAIAGTCPWPCPWQNARHGAPIISPALRYGIPWSDSPRIPIIRGIYPAMPCYMLCVSPAESIEWSERRPSPVFGSQKLYCLWVASYPFSNLGDCHNAWPAAYSAQIYLFSSYEPEHENAAWIQPNWHRTKLPQSYCIRNPNITALFLMHVTNQQTLQILSTKLWIIQKNFSALKWTRRFHPSPSGLV